MVVEGVTQAQVISIEPDTLFDELEEVAHAHAVSAEPDALLGESEILEEVVCAQTEGAELHLGTTTGRTRSSPRLTRRDHRGLTFFAVQSAAS